MYWVHKHRAGRGVLGAQAPCRARCTGCTSTVQGEMCTSTMQGEVYWVHTSTVQGEVYWVHKHRAGRGVLGAQAPYRARCTGCTSTIRGEVYWVHKHHTGRGVMGAQAPLRETLRICFKMPRSFYFKFRQLVLNGSVS